jgi:hypothetical protein
MLDISIYSKLVFIIEERNLEGKVTIGVAIIRISALLKGLIRWLDKWFFQVC